MSQDNEDLVGLRILAWGVQTARKALRALEGGYKTPGTSSIVVAAASATPLSTKPRRSGIFGTAPDVVLAAHRVYPASHTGAG